MTVHYSIPGLVEALQSARESLGAAVDLAQDVLTAGAVPEGVDGSKLAALEDAFEAVGTALAELDA